MKQCIILFGCKPQEVWDTLVVYIKSKILLMFQSLRNISHLKMNILYFACWVILMVASKTEALPQLKRIDQNPQTATILQHENNNIGVGNYNFAYQTSDGVSREERAELKNPGTDNEVLVVQGSYSYVGSDGNTYTVNYVADENGYRAIGSHIPGN